MNFLTPLRVPGRDTAVLVNRGGVDAPDGQTVEGPRWRERDTVTVRGFIETFTQGGTGPVGSPTRPRLVRRTDRDSLAAQPLPQLLSGRVGVDELMISKDEDRDGKGIDDSPESKMRTAGCSHAETFYRPRTIGWSDSGSKAVPYNAATPWTDLLPACSSSI